MEMNQGFSWPGKRQYVHYRLQLHWHATQDVQRSSQTSKQSEFFIMKVISAVHVSQKCSPYLQWSQRMTSWNPFSNNEVLNPQLRSLPELMMLRYFMCWRLPCHTILAPVCSISEHDCLERKWEDIEQNQTLVSAFLQTASLFHPADADTESAVQASVILPAIVCVCLCVGACETVCVCACVYVFTLDKEGWCPWLHFSCVIEGVRNLNVDL